VTPLELLPPDRKAIGNNYDNMTYSTKLGVDVNENLTLNGVARYTDADACALRRYVDPVAFTSFRPRHRARKSYTSSSRRGEAVWSVLNGGSKSYFGINYTITGNYNISPGDAAPPSTR